MKAILDAAFPGKKTIRGSSGSTLPTLNDTLPPGQTPPNVSSVTFAFVCAGSTSAKISLAVNGKPLPSAAADQPCNNSIYQRTIPVSPDTSIDFNATVVGPIAGASNAWNFYPN